MTQDYYKEIKTPKELLAAITDLLEQLHLLNESFEVKVKPGAGIYEEVMVVEQEIQAAQQAAIRIRAENLSLDLPPVPSGGSIPAIQNWCIDAEKCFNKSAKDIIIETNKSLDDIDNKLILLIQEVEKNPNAKLPSASKIAQALHRNKTTATELSRQTILNRLEKLRELGLISPKNQDQICAPEHIEDMEGDEKTEENF